MNERPLRARELASLLSRFPAVALLGPRQSGKTTLARLVAAARRGPVHAFDLERPRDAARLEDPELALSGLRGLVVLDEVQHRPDLFPVLRVLCDRRPLPARFLVLGSASPELLRQGSESLAGRLARYDLDGFTLDEAGPALLRRLWFRGGLPPSFLARSDAASAEWRREYVAALVERDLPKLGIPIPPGSARRFWTMVAHYHGQTWNASEIARSLAVSDATVRRYLDLLESAFLVRVLRPWHENLSKRQVRAPKVYVRDAGLLHTLLAIPSPEDLEGHPKLGASWEGFGLAEVVRRLGARPDECHFWATHGGAELDLLVVRGKRRLGFEFKRTTAPRVTPSMRTALRDLRLERLDVLHAGAESWMLGPRIRALALSRILGELRPLGS